VVLSLHVSYAKYMESPYCKRGSATYDRRELRALVGDDRQVLWFVIISICKVAEAATGTIACRYSILLPRATGKPEASMKKKACQIAINVLPSSSTEVRNQLAEDHRHARQSKRNKASLRDIEAESHQPGWRFSGFLEKHNERSIL
jgi:hypothetical protein